MIFQGLWIGIEIGGLALVISVRAFLYYRLVLERSAAVVPPFGFNAPRGVPLVIFGGGALFSAISERCGDPWNTAPLACDEIAPYKLSCLTRQL